jgi:GNAT superfamily N-acetyltransferase
MSDVGLRAWTPADRALAEGLARAFHAEDGHPLDEGGVRAIGELCDGHPLARGWFVVCDGAIVGYAVLALGFSVQYGGADGFLDDLFLLPEARGRGIGVRVMALIEAEAVGLGARAIHLVVHPLNLRAQRLYARSGFEPAAWVLMSRRVGSLTTTLLEGELPAA